MVDWTGGVFASCITRVQLHVNACNWMATVSAAAPLALANQLPLPRLQSALVRSSRKLRYIRIRPLLFYLLALATINMSTKFEVFISTNDLHNSTHYEDTKCKISKIGGRHGRLGMINPTLFSLTGRCYSTSRFYAGIGET